jgi:hypothetical protein
MVMVQAERISGIRSSRRAFSASGAEKKMVKESNGPPTDRKSYKDMSGRELLLKIMELTAANDITDHQLQEILESIERILSERKTPGK